MNIDKKVKAAARLLGQRGGKKSRANVSPERAREIATKAGQASGQARREKKQP